MVSKRSNYFIAPREDVGTSSLPHEDVGASSLPHEDDGASSPPRVQKRAVRKLTPKKKIGV
jgi:hypothetical protein